MRAQMRVTLLCLTALVLLKPLEGLAAEGSLTIAEGVVVQFGEDAGLLIESQFVADEAVVLTGLNDPEFGGQTIMEAPEPQPGLWRGVELDPDAGVDALQLIGVTIRFADIAIGPITQPMELLRLTLRDNLIALFLDGADGLLMSEMQISDNEIGIEIGSPSNSSIADSVLSGNVQFAVRNLNPDFEFDARSNWWGSTDGPYHPLSNPFAAGDSISDGVLYEPFLEEPPLHGCSVSLADGEYIRTNPQIELNLSCPHAVDMRVSEDPEFVGISYQPYQSMIEYELSPESGEKQIYVEFRSALGEQLLTQLPQVIHFQSPLPYISINSPVLGQIISDDIVISASIESVYPITEARFFVGQYLLAIVTDAPYEVAWIIDGYQSGIYNLRVRAVNQSGYESEEIIQVDLQPGGLGNEPVARNIAYTVPQGDQLEVGAADGILSNDHVPLGVDSLELVSGVLNGQLELSQDGAFVYVPQPGFFGSDQFVYRIHSDGLTSNNATVTIAVTPPNRPPVANHIHFVTPIDQSLSVPPPGVLVNDVDPDGDSLVAILVEGPSYGQLTLYPNGSFLYQPAAGFQGQDVFVYSAQDPEGLSDTAEVTITVAGDPVAVDDFYTGTEGQVLAVGPEWGVLANDILNGHSVSVELVQGPEVGSLQLHPDGSFAYTPPELFFGELNFDYRLAYFGGTSAPARVYLTIEKVNHPPVARPLVYIADYQTMLDVAASDGVLSNDTDVHNDPLTAHLVDAPVYGQIELREDGSFSYLPNTGFLGVDHFIYEARDPEGLTAQALITIEVTPGPMALNDVYFLAVGESLELEAPGVLENDHHTPQNDPLLAVLIREPAHGMAVLEADGALIYIPDPEFQGVDFLEYRATTGYSDSNIASVTFAVGTTSFPIAQSVDGIQGIQGQVLVYEDSVLDNDFDPHGLPLTAELVPGSYNTGAAGHFELNPDGTFTLEPSHLFRGDFTFNYVAFNGQQISNEATVRVHIAPVNQGVIARDYSYGIEPGEVLERTAARGVTRNDYHDPYFGTLLVTLESGPQHGTLVLNSDGSFRYEPSSSFVGFDSFVYRAQQTAGDYWDTATITIVSNTAPVVPPLYLELNEDSFYDFGTLPNPLATAYDPDGDEIWVVSPTGEYPVCRSSGLGGYIWYCLQQDGVLSIEARYNFCGTLPGSLRFDVTDGISVTRGHIYLEVLPMPDAPVANDNSYLFYPEQLADVGPEDGVLKNDFDPDKQFEHYGCFDPDTEPTRARLAEPPGHGVLELDADGAFRYLPDPGFTGVDSFVYEAYDGTGLYDTATVSLVINAPPVGEPNSYQLDENSVLSVAAPGVLENDTDPNAGNAVLRARRYTPSGQCSPCHGSLLLRPNGSFDYQPETNFHGQDRFWYQVGNGTRWSSPIEVTLQVFRVRHPLQLEPDLYRGYQNTVLIVSATHGVLMNDEELDGLDFWVDAVVDYPEHGELVLEADGSFVYVPDPSFFGEDSFVYRAINESGLTAEAPVTLIIRHVNSPPVASNNVYEVLAGAVLAVDAEDGVLSNDFDIDGDPLQAYLVRPPVLGDLELQSDGSFIFAAPDGPSQIITWSYQVRDGKGGVDAAEVEMRVINESEPPLPVLNDDQYLVEGLQLLVPAHLGVLANDQDVAGHSVILLDAPEFGQLSLQGDGGFVYIADPLQRTPQVFRYGLAAVPGLAAEVTLDFLDTGPALQARPISFHQVGSGVMSVSAPGVMANDDAVDAVVELVEAPPVEHGSLVLNADGSFLFQPDPEFVGMTSFRYRLIRDGQISNLAVVSIWIDAETGPVDQIFGDQFSSILE